MQYPPFQVGSFARLGHWLPGYSRTLLWALGISLLFMGAGLALCGPIYGSMVAGMSANPHTPIYVRANEAVHLKVVGRVTLAGLLLFGMGVSSLAVYLGLCRYSERRGRF